MAQSIRDVMTADPRTLPADATVSDAARAMRDEAIGDVLVTQDGSVCGIITDRDIVVRAIAEGQDPNQTRLGDICSHDLTSLTPDGSVDDAVRLMRERALRRMPVIDGDRLVGVVSIGDLAIERDSESALADISAAPPNT